MTNTRAWQAQLKESADIRRGRMWANTVGDPIDPQVLGADRACSGCGYLLCSCPEAVTPPLGESWDHLKEPQGDGPLDKKLLLVSRAAKEIRLFCTGHEWVSTRAVKCSQTARVYLELLFKDVPPIFLWEEDKSLKFASSNPRLLSLRFAFMLTKDQLLANLLAGAEGMGPLPCPLHVEHDGERRRVHFGAVVLDVDPRNPKEVALDQLYAEYQELNDNP